MVIDSSALIAILLGEPDATILSQAILAAPSRLVATPTLVETVMVLSSRIGGQGERKLDDLLRFLGIQTVAFTEVHARLAMAAFLRFGKGRHRAGLNFGDCRSYALAAEARDVLLFKGQDFVHTDISPALP